MIIRSICNFMTRDARRTTKEEKETEYNDVKGTKEESRGKKVAEMRVECRQRRLT